MADTRHDTGAAQWTRGRTYVTPVDESVRQYQHLRSPDTRTVDQRVTAEFVRLVDCLQLLTLKVEALESFVAGLDETMRLTVAPVDVALQVDELRQQVISQSVTIGGLEAYIRYHSDGDDVLFATLPLAMAEDAWGRP